MDVRLSFIFYLLSLTAHIVCPKAQLAVELTCDVDYHGHIIFKIKIPPQYQNNGRRKPMLFYKKDSSVFWSQKKDCMTVQKKVLQCDMYELVKKERYNLKLSITANETLFNISKVIVNNNRTNWVWNTTDQYFLCKNGVGTKFMALDASYDNITLHWIKQPLDSTMGQAAISVKSNKRNHTFAVTYTSCHNVKNGTCSCKNDVCRYYLKNLKSCTLYKVCINTKESQMHDLKCKNIETYCDSNSRSPALRWQDILLTIFGIVILFVCCLLVWGIIIRYKTHQVVNDHDNDDLCPRNNIHRQEENCLGVLDAPSIYHCPDDIHNKLHDEDVKS